VVSKLALANPIAGKAGGVLGGTISGDD